MTEQADFWGGSFGDEYIGRNDSSELLASNLSLFAQVLSHCDELPKSFLELGANIGMNYEAVSLLSPNCDFFGVEVNQKAFDVLVSKGARGAKIPLEDFSTSEQFEFVFTKGVLIHLNPDSLIDVYKKMGEFSSKFVFICEYFNPTPLSISYRGNENKLFKRDFGGEFLTHNTDFYLVAGGFASNRGPFPQDNLNWELFKRKKSL